MDVSFAGRIPKDASFPEASEDAFELAAKVGRIAISDGASESFDSKTWAELLALRYVGDPTLTETWLTTAIADYVAHFDVSALSWSKQAAFARGSFATLLGIEALPVQRTLKILAVGDSLAVLLDSGDFVASFPYARAERFQERPDLLCTRTPLNGFIGAADFSVKYCTTWSLEEYVEPSILGMTDALAEWALRCAEEGRPMWQALDAIRTMPELETLVLHERKNAKGMRVDDTTLVRVSFSELNGNALPDD